MLSAIAARNRQSEGAKKKKKRGGNEIPRLTPKFVDEELLPSTRRRKQPPNFKPPPVNNSYAQNTAQISNTGTSEYVTISDPRTSPAINSRGSKAKRGWSPSLPLDDEIDENGEDSDSGDQILNLGYMGPAVDVGLSSETRPTFPSTVSTFMAVPRKNWFPAGGQERTRGVVILSPEETICFVGIALIEVLYGTIELLGDSITSEDCKIKSRVLFSSKSTSLPVMQAVPAQPVIDFNVRTLPEEIQRYWDPNKTILRITSIKDQQLRGIDQVIPILRQMFELPFPETARTLELEGFYLLSSSFRESSAFVLPPEWRAILDSIIHLRVPHPANSPITDYVAQISLVKGPKGSGKSTFGRTLLNRLLHRYPRVAYLDCDVGQSEFSPGGLVTLHVVSQPLYGPPFTHILEPVSSHFIGSVTPRSSPSQYLSAISALLETYRLDHQYALKLHANDSAMDESPTEECTPLIVNTQGWLKGMGADLLRSIEELVQPTHVFEMQGYTPENETDNEGLQSYGKPPAFRARFNEAPGTTSWLDTPPMMHLGPEPKIISLPSVPSPSSQSSADLRALSIMSYFHFDTRQGTWDTSRSLLETPPYEVDVPLAFDAIILVGPGSEDVKEENIARVLNCSLVALVESDEPMDAEFKSRRIPYISGTPPPDPTSSRCHGLAFIRGVSVVDDSLRLQLLTPIPPDLLGRCRVLVKGDMEMPIWAFIGSANNDGPGKEWMNEKLLGVEWGKVPYLAYRHGGTGRSVVGSGVRRPRKNIMRKGQM